MERKHVKAGPATEGKPIGAGANPAPEGRSHSSPPATDRLAAKAVLQAVGRESPLIGAAIVATMLRTYQLAGQIPIDDEWHALYQALHSNVFEILTHFGDSDVSIPIALYFKVLMATIGLSDWTLRAPFLLAGLATVIMFPLMVRPFVGRFPANLFAWMLAISPQTVFFSRYARPYSLALLCAFAAVIAFRAWWDTRERRWAVSYVGLAAVGCWLHLTDAPFVLGSFLVFGVGALGGAFGSRTRAIRRLAGLGAVSLAGMAIVLAPPLVVDFADFLRRAGGKGLVTGNHVTKALTHAISAGDPAVALGVGLLAIVGAGALLVRSRLFAVQLLALAGFQVAASYWFHPVAGWFAEVGARYILPALPVILLFAAVGVAAASSVLGERVGRWVRLALAVAGCAAMAWMGPIRLIVDRPNNWASLYLGESMDWYRTYYSPAIRRVPEFYQRLATRPPGSITIVEATNSLFSFNNPLPFYQRIHRQKILIGMHNGLCGPPSWGEVPYGNHSMRFRNHVFLTDPSALRRRGASYVVFHRDLGREMIFPTTWPWSIDLSACIDKYRDLVGPPAYEDFDIVVFDLATRTAAFATPPGPSSLTTR